MIEECKHENIYPEAGECCDICGECDDVCIDCGEELGHF